MNYADFYNYWTHLCVVRKHCPCPSLLRAVHSGFSPFSSGRLRWAAQFLLYKFTNIHAPTTASSLTHPHLLQIYQSPSRDFVCWSCSKMWLYDDAVASCCFCHFLRVNLELLHDSRSHGAFLTHWPLTGSEWQIKGRCLWAERKAHHHLGTRRRSREDGRRRSER